MNVENINKLIEYVKVRTWRTSNWSNRQDCACGMIADITDGDRRLAYEAILGIRTVEQFLGAGNFNADASQAGADLSGLAIYTMSTFTKAGGYKDRKEDVYDRFAALPTEQQNAVLVDMLERFRDTGEVIWNIP